MASCFLLHRFPSLLLCSQGWAWPAGESLSHGVLHSQRVCSRASWLNLRWLQSASLWPASGQEQVTDVPPLKPRLPFLCLQQSVSCPRCSIASWFYLFTLHLTFWFSSWVRVLLSAEGTFLSTSTASPLPLRSFFSPALSVTARVSLQSRVPWKQSAFTVTMLSPPPHTSPMDEMGLTSGTHLPCFQTWGRHSHSHDQQAWWPRLKTILCVWPEQLCCENRLCSVPRYFPIIGFIVPFEFLPCFLWFPAHP